MKNATFKIENKTDRKTKIQSLELSGDLSFKNSGAILSKLKTLKSRAESCVISLKDVINIDITLIQSIHAYKSKRESEGASVSLKANLPDDLGAILSNTGFLEYSK